MRATFIGLNRIALRSVENVWPMLYFPCVPMARALSCGTNHIFTRVAIRSTHSTWLETQTEEFACYSNSGSCTYEKNYVAEGKEVTFACNRNTVGSVSVVTGHRD